MDYLPLPRLDPPALVQKLPPPKLEVPKGVRTGYPLRSSWWTHPDEIHAHLKTGEHSGKWMNWWVDSLTAAQAESLHSDDHEGRVRWEYVPKAVAKPVSVAYTLPASMSSCPNGNCPNQQSAPQRRGILGWR